MKEPIFMADIYTVKEVAERLKTSTRFVLSQIRAGKLPAVKVGKAYRIHAADLERYLQPTIAHNY
jgi:excisionase family DNA binding protein